MLEFQEEHLFTSGAGGYFLYRIPALAISQSGTILAFCEARKFTGDDADQIDILLRRRLDGGQTFEAPQLILSNENWVCGNPVPVVDRDTGVIWLLFTKNLKGNLENRICLGEGTRSVWITHSRDDGETWAEAVEITGDVKPPDWGWYATGPGHGIQLSSGRLLIPCDHSVIQPDRDQAAAYFSHVIYSDDHGCTWRPGGNAPEGTNECMAVETIAGQVYLNSRNAPGSQAQRCAPDHPEDKSYYRAYAWSEDGGMNFLTSGYDSAMPEPICQSSICRLTDQNRHDRSRVIFANPASQQRENLTVRLSYDECRTWPVSRILYPGCAAYSDLCVTDDLTICCLYERGINSPYETITLARFTLAWLEAAG